MGMLVYVFMTFLFIVPFKKSLPQTFDPWKG